jgi:predicted nuclease with TOPRIM domain
LVRTCASLGEEISHLKSRVPQIKDILENLSSEKTALEAKFENAGGLSEDVREQIKNQIQSQDVIKSDNSKKIRYL